MAVAVALGRPRGRGAAPFGADDSVGIGGQHDVDDRLQQRSHQIWRRFSKGLAEQAARVDNVWSGHRDVPFERSVEGELEGSRGGRVYVQARDDLGVRATPLSGTQLRRRPEPAWLADITAHWTREGKLYVCAIKDRLLQPDRRLLHRLIVEVKDRGRSTRQRGLRRRAEGVDVAGCVLHTDRGSQYRSRRLVHQLNRHRLVGSMGRVGAAGHNAAMESFFSLLQKNVLHPKSGNTREELRITIVTWIERTYHRRRRQAALGRLTPVEYELIMTPTATQAA